MKKVVLIVMLIIIQQIFAQNDNENQTDKDNNKRAISYQSQIKNSEGQPIEDGKYKVVFNLYDSEKEEKPVWFETQILEIKDGILNALIGSKKKLQAGDFKEQLWLTIEIDDEESEKQFVTASSYSMMAARLDPDALIAGESVSLIEQPDGKIRIDMDGPPNNPELYINSLIMNLTLTGAEYFNIKNKSGVEVGMVLWNSGSSAYQGGSTHNDFVLVAKDGRDMVLKSDPNTTTGASGKVYVGTKAKTNDLTVTGIITSNKLKTEVDNNLTIEAAQSTTGEIPYLPYSESSGNINIGTPSNANNLNVTGGLDVKGTSKINNDIEITGNITGMKDINLTGTLNATNVNSSGNINSNSINSKYLKFGIIDIPNNYEDLIILNHEDNPLGGFLYRPTNPAWNGSDSGEYLGFYAENGRDVVIKSNKNSVSNKSGDVFIGTYSCPNNLHVYGTLSAREIIANYTVWPDYVFNHNYNLLSLNEIDNHINEHGRLPGMPSEKEVLESGVNINQMQLILVEKIEELTLHMIRLEKENSDLKARMDSINK